MNWTTFQTILIIVFGFVLFMAVLIFSCIIPGWCTPSGGLGGTVTLWGPLEQNTADRALEPLKRAYEKEFTLVYVAKNPATIESDLVEALAAGQGPDLVILPATALWRERNKLAPLGFELVSRRDFADQFTRGADLYLGADGSWALPLAVDPLLLYYNVDLLNAGRLVKPPVTWEELQTMAGILSSSDRSGNLRRSTVALGESSNIPHAKDILSLLVLQTGNPLTRYNERGALEFSLNDRQGRASAPAAEALTFFTRFADPTNKAYSWNASEPPARDAFVRGQSVFYLGYASEYASLHRQNPQLSIDAASAPQVGDATKLNFARFYGLSLTRAAPNAQTAAFVAQLLVGSEMSAALAHALGAAPASAAALARRPADPLAAVAYEAAITARAWLDPDPEATNGIFQNLIREVKIGRATAEQAVDQTQLQLNELLNQ